MTSSHHRCASGDGRVSSPRSPLAYSPRPGPLSDAGPLAASAYLGSLARGRLRLLEPDRPRRGRGGGRGCGPARRRRPRGRRRGSAGARSLGVFVIAVNALAAQRGETILVRGWELPVLGQIDVSAEALVEGAVLALRIGVVMVAFARAHRPASIPTGCCAWLRPLAPPLGPDRHPDHPAGAAGRRRPRPPARSGGAARPRRGRRSVAPRSRDGWSPARSTAPSTSPRRSSCAATAAALRRRAAMPARDGARWRFAACGVGRSLPR